MRWTWPISSTVVVLPFEPVSAMNSCSSSRQPSSSSPITRSPAVSAVCDHRRLARDARALDHGRDAGEQVRALLPVAHLHARRREPLLDLGVDHPRVRPDHPLAARRQRLRRGHARAGEADDEERAGRERRARDHGPHSSGPRSPRLAARPRTCRSGTARTGSARIRTRTRRGRPARPSGERAVERQTSRVVANVCHIGPTGDWSSTTGGPGRRARDAAADRRRPA